MKSRIFSISLAIAAGTIAAAACGPYNPIMPTPAFFAAADPGTGDLQKAENLRLWQQLTSPDIPLEDIDEEVYHNSDTYYGPWDDPSDNKFRNYIEQADEEICDFLNLANQIYRERTRCNSPWYYPASRNQEESPDFAPLLEKCAAYRGTRLRDRYALQAVRCLFASRQYDRCITYYDSAFAAFPAENLFRRMAAAYVAGCRARLGDTEGADSLFALADDLGSLSCPDPVAYMAGHNPDSRSLMEHIRSLAPDSARFCAVVPVAQGLIDSRRPLRYPGDWHFVLAYAAGQHRHDYAAARRHIARALAEPFSSDSFRDHARAYAMLIAGEHGDKSALLSELKWLETKVSITDADSYEWNRILKNIIFDHYVPVLWQQDDYTTAILLCGYADNLYASQKRFNVCDDWREPAHTVSIDEMRRRPDMFNPQDYCTLTFRLMESLKSGQLISVMKKSAAGNPLYTFLRRYARTDADYFNELIGTLAIREENFPRAVEYLAKVSPLYKKCLNTAPWLDGDNAKLDYARRMLALSRTIRSGADADARGLARLEYTLSQRDASWAITDYRRGYIGHLFEPILDYWYERSDNRFTFLYDPENEDCDATCERRDNEIEAALAMLTTDEARARAQYLLGNLKTVIRRYPHTAVAATVRTSCDNWHSWL